MSQKGLQDEGSVFAINWFRNRLNEVKELSEKLYVEFRISEVLKIIYSLAWDDFCSWYLEWVKPGFEQPVPQEVVEQSIRFFEEILQLLHPFMPFITEEMYHLLLAREDDLCVKQFSAIGKMDQQVLMQGKLLKDAITSIRDARNKAQIKPKQPVELYIHTNEPNQYAEIAGILSKQVNAQTTQFTENPVERSVTVVSGMDKFYLVGEQAVDTGLQRKDLQKELDYLKGFLNSVNSKLSNERFLQNAKPEVVSLELRKKEDAEAKIKIIEESLSTLL